MNKAKDGLDLTSRHILYCLFILPYFGDCTQVWGDMSMSNSKTFVCVTEKSKNTYAITQTRWI